MTLRTAVLLDAMSELISSLHALEIHDGHSSDIIVTLRDSVWLRVFYVWSSDFGLGNKDVQMRWRDKKGYGYPDMMLLGIRIRPMCDSLLEPTDTGLILDALETQGGPHYKG